MEALRWLDLEAAAMEQRLKSIAPFRGTIPMVSAAVPALDALDRADRAVRIAKKGLERRLGTFRWDVSRASTPARDSGRRVNRLRHQFTALRLRMHALFSSVDIFADALSQRAEHGTGVLLRGLDELARDGLRLRDRLLEPPPLVCYLDRGIGGAIRRAFTRLPGGEQNGVALIRVPRERICGQGLASLLHEVAHEGVADLRLDLAYAAEFGRLARAGILPAQEAAWWSFKVRETLCDLWACAKLGLGGTMGLAGVLSLFPAFTFHDDPRDVHPMPWLRVVISTAFGASVLPHPLWCEVADLWRHLYPRELAPRLAQDQLARLLPTVPLAVHVFAHHRPEPLRGLTLAEALGACAVHPGRLIVGLREALRAFRNGMRPKSLCLALGMLGLARHLGHISPADEYALLVRMLNATDETALDRATSTRRQGE